MSKIVQGGGWKDQRGERLKVKAWGFLFVAIFGGGIAAVFLDDWKGVMWLNAGSLVCFMISVVLFFVERPRGIGWYGQQAGGDLHNLYGAGGGVDEGRPGKRRDEGSTGADQR